jgi:hypothetical protein
VVIKIHAVDDGNLLKLFSGAGAAPLLRFQAGDIGATLHSYILDLVAEAGRSSHRFGTE